MKKFVVMLVVLVVGLVAVSALASQKGVDAVKYLVQDYYGTVPNVEDLGNDTYRVSGGESAEVIHFSDKLINRLVRLRSNPRSGESLDVVCPTQARQIRKAMHRSKSAVVVPVPVVPNPVPPVPVAQVSACPGNNCQQGEGRWNPADARQPESGKISYRVGADAMKIMSHLNCSGVQIWYDDGKWAKGKITFFFPNEEAKQRYLQSQRPSQSELIQSARQLPITPASVGRQQWLKFTPL